MAQALFETSQQRLVVTCLDIDDATGRQAGLRHRGSEQILPRKAPQHLALGAGRDAGGEQRGRRAIDRAISSPGNFMQGTKRKSALGQMFVDLLDAEGQDGPPPSGTALKALNALTKFLDARKRDGRTHVLLQLFPAYCMFSICSLNAIGVNWGLPQHEDR